MLLAVSPVPSWPEELRPHATKLPSAQRARLENALKGEGEKPVAENWRGRIKVFHPREAASALAAELQKAERTSWFD